MKKNRRKPRSSGRKKEKHRNTVNDLAGIAVRQTAAAVPAFLFAERSVYFSSI